MLYKTLIESEVRKYELAHASWSGNKFEQKKCEREFYYWLEVLYSM